MQKTKVVWYGLHNIHGQMIEHGHKYKSPSKNALDSTRQLSTIHRKERRVLGETTRRETGKLSLQQVGSELSKIGCTCALRGDGSTGV